MKTEMRRQAMQALAAIGPDAQPAVPALATALAAPEANVRSSAVEALGKLAAVAQVAREALVKALNDYRSGARKNDMMSLVAPTLKDNDIDDLAAYYAAIEVIVGPPPK